MRSERGVEVSSHLTEYENSILRTFWPEGHLDNNIAPLTGRPVVAYKR